MSYFRFLQISFILLFSIQNIYSQVENSSASILHEWYSHWMKKNRDSMKSHRLAYKNVINYKYFWNKTTNNYKGFNVRKLKKYTKDETYRDNVDPIYRYSYNKYNAYGKCFYPYSLPTFEQYLFDIFSSTTFDSIVVTYWNVYDHIFNSYKIIYIKEKKIIYVEPETNKTAKRFYLRDSIVISVFLDNINRYYVQNEKIIYNKISKKKEDWAEYDIPTFDVECFEKKKRLLFKYTKLEDGYYELEFSHSFVEFVKLIQLAIDLYDNLYTKSKN